MWRFTHLEVHALIGITRQTLNRVPHNQHKMRITQAMSNSLEYLLALHRKRSRTPHNHHDRSRRQSPPSARRISSTGRVRSTLTGHRSASGAIPSVLCRPVSLTRRRNQRPVLSDPASGQLTDANVFVINSFSLLTSSPLIQCANHKNLHPAQ